MLLQTKQERERCQYKCSFLNARVELVFFYRLRKNLYV